MRVHARLFLGHKLLVEHTSEGTEFAISREGHLAHPWLPPGGFTVKTDGYSATLTNGDGTRRLRRKNVLPIEGDLRLMIDLYPHPDAVPATRGACPSCGGTLRETQIGGAYRSVARSERRCADCDAIVIELAATAQSIGQFTDHAADDWVHVSTAYRCPRCTQSMLRSRFATEHGEAEVERCATCQLVLLEPSDQRELRGDA